MTKLLKNAAIGLSTVAALALAQPSIAADTAGASATAAAAVGAAAAKSQAKPAQPKKYCVNVIPDTGSRMARKSCRTKEEWAEEGVDVGSKN